MLAVRRHLLREHQGRLGGYIFDGFSLFMTRKLESDSVELVGRARDKSVYQIKIKYVAELSMTDGRAMQVLNLILRRAMGGLNLQLVQRNFYDAAARVSVQNLDTKFPLNFH